MFKCKDCKYCYWEDLDHKLSCEKGIKNIYDMDLDYNIIDNDKICDYFEMKNNNAYNKSNKQSFIKVSKRRIKWKMK